MNKLEKRLLSEIKDPTIGLVYTNPTFKKPAKIKIKWSAELNKFAVKIVAHWNNTDFKGEAYFHKNLKLDELFIW